MENQRYLKYVIIEIASSNTKGEYIWNLPTRPKTDGSNRIILNHKQFNKHYVNKDHFKTETYYITIRYYSYKIQWIY